jgi:molybdate transport system ATP-binding protein
LLLLDEPLVALDEPLKERILAYLDRVLREWRVPTLYVSHSQAEVRRLAHWVVAIQKGKAVASGPVDEVLGSGLEALSNGSFAPMNLLCVEATERLPGGGWAGKLGPQSVQLPEEAEPPADHRCYVQFTPQAVNLGVGPAADGLSARNRLGGTIDRLLPRGSVVFVLVDVGQPIWAEVTPEAVAALGLKPGAAVTCLIKTTAMQVIP